MSTTVAPVTQQDAVPASPAGPLPGEEPLPQLPPRVDLPRALQTLRVSVRQIEFVFARAARARRRVPHATTHHGRRPVVTCHPDHVQSLFTARPEQAPSLTGESPLRPIVGPNSVLTATGPRHMRQRKLLLPPFHGEAVARYTG